MSHNFVPVLILIIPIAFFGCSKKADEGKPKSEEMTKTATRDVRHGYPSNYSEFVDSVLEMEAEFALPTLCTESELTVFGCKMVSGKTLSICASKKKTKPALVYRFGTSSSIELQFPRESETSLDQFSYYWYLRGFGCENEGMDQNYLTFDNEGFRYTVYTEYTACSEHTDAGVRVERTNGKSIESIADLHCAEYSGSLLDFRFRPIVYCPDCRDTRDL